MLPRKSFFVKVILEHVVAKKSRIGKKNAAGREKSRSLASVRNSKEAPAAPAE